MKPPTKDERPETARVDEAVRAPVMLSEEFTEDDESETKPPASVERPEIAKVVEPESAPAKALLPVGVME